MTYFIRNGNMIRLTDQAAIDITETLAPGNYIVKLSDEIGYYLEETDRFVSLPKYYGDIMTKVDRILHSFFKRPSGTGVMLSGEKGSGKTLLAKEVSIHGYDLGYPTLLVNSCFVGDQFNKFIQDIDQPTIIVFDEFEKIYPAEKQPHILTLFDGVYPTKKLFIVSCNDPWKIDGHMRNRPGRFYYLMDFTGLERQFIVEYCEDHGMSHEYTTQICNFASMFKAFSFDILKAIVEECKRFNESPVKAIQYLNARPHNEGGSTYDISLFVDDTKITKSVYPNECTSNPLTLEKMNVNFYTHLTLVGTGINVEEDDDGSTVASMLAEDEGNQPAATAQPVKDKYCTIKFAAGDMTTYDTVTGTFTFQKGNVKIIMVRQKKSNYDWAALL
jgi:hypothetical protein